MNYGESRGPGGYRDNRSPYELRPTLNNTNYEYVY